MALLCADLCEVSKHVLTHAKIDRRMPYRISLRLEVFSRFLQKMRGITGWRLFPKVHLLKRWVVVVFGWNWLMLTSNIICIDDASLNFLLRCGAMRLSRYCHHPKFVQENKPMNGNWQLRYLWNKSIFIKTPINLQSYCLWSYAWLVPVIGACDQCLWSVPVIGARDQCLWSVPVISAFDQCLCE